MKEFDLIIKNGTVVTSTESFLCDVAVKDGKIAAMAQNIEADAFPIVVLDILYGEEKKKNFLEEEATELAKYVVAPPDSGIDIVVEHEDSDDYSYDFIQVKSSALPEVEN